MAQILKHLWHALEKVPDLKTIPAEWAEIAQQDYACLQAYLRPTSEQSCSYPCPVPGGADCPRNIIQHTDGTIVAVCGDYPKQCEKIALTRSDITVQELNVRLLAATVSAALGIVARFQETEYSFLFLIGDYTPTAHYRFPVYLALSYDRETLRHTIAEMSAKTKGKPFVLLLPTRSQIDHRIERLLDDMQGHPMILNEIIIRNAEGKLNGCISPSELMRDFHDKVCPMPAVEESFDKFPTPSDALWGDISIQFVDGHRVSIRCKDITRQVNYTQMGFADSRNGEPTKQWIFLQALAEAKGRLGWRDSSASPEYRQQKRFLSKGLKTFFGISSDPIVWDEKCYRTRFTILSDDC